MILLLGGSKKGLDYKRLFSHLPKRVKKIIVYGEIADDLFNANNGNFDIEKAENLSLSFEIATKLAKKNDSIVLSPASASYDQFSSFIERGKLFNKLVSEYEISTKKE